MYIKKINRLLDSEEIIKVEFEYNGQEAEFSYTLIGLDVGIDRCTYNENDEEDIYGIIGDWVEEHIKTETKVLFDGSEVEFE